MFKTFIGVIVFLTGLASLFLPHLSGWMDIVFPSIAYEFLILFFFWEILFVGSLILLLLFVLVSFKQKASRNKKFLFTSCAVGLMLLFWAIYPDFATAEFLGTKQRFSFFEIGGQTRLLWAGGAKTVRTDALLLLSQETDKDGFVRQDQWAASLRKLGVYWIQVERETQSVIIFIPRTAFFDAAQFGYLISAKPEPDPGALHADWYRVWKRAEGIYFFQY